MVRNKAPQGPLFEKETRSAMDAISQAQFIAFAPYVFHASVLLRDKGILGVVEAARAEGLSIEEVTEKVDLPHYGVRILLEAGLGIGLVLRKDNKYTLSKTGHFFLNDNMTRVNTDFMLDVCYEGSKELESSIKDSKPNGLKYLGDWPTIYQGLSLLPEPAKTSWFNFDHYYSDHTFPEAMPMIFKHQPKKVMDIGANTGKFSLAALNYNNDVELGLVDLGIQLNVAKGNIEEAGLASRATYHERNVLDKDSELPEGYDTIWMSQFLDCFADDEVVFILEKCHRALNDDGRVFINELFWDRQKFEASAFSLQMTSLYFTTMANGNSQMYDSKVFLQFIDKAGFEIVSSKDNIGQVHTILELKKK